MRGSIRGDYVRELWEDKILREYTPVLQLQNVYRGESVFIDYKVTRQAVL